jgi:hypothetical protein
MGIHPRTSSLRMAVSTGLAQDDPTYHSPTKNAPLCLGAIPEGGDSAVPPTFYSTVPSNLIRPYMPAVPVLLTAASFTRYSRRRGAYYLRTPSLPAHITEKAADCGGFVATIVWGGSYRFSWRQYVAWLSAWQPRWAATMDLCCIADAKTAAHPGAAEVQRRQDFTTEMAYRFWECARDVPWSWVPTIQGHSLVEYERHARDLCPLVREMYTYYADTGSTDEEQEVRPSPFRVGIGSLACRGNPKWVHAVIATVQAIIGRDIPLLLWGAAKLRLARSALQLPEEVSLDSAAWNQLFAHEHEARRRSPYSEAEYSWKISHPRYMLALQSAFATAKQGRLSFLEEQPPELAWLRPAPPCSARRGE